MDLIPKLPSSTSRFMFCWLDKGTEGTIIQEIEEQNIQILNIGKEISHSIKSDDGRSTLPFKVTHKLEEELDKQAVTIEGYDCPIIAIENIGAVKEPDLKIDFEQILNDICRSVCVILIWNDQYEDGKFIVESDYNYQVYLSFSQPVTELSF